MPTLSNLSYGGTAAIVTSMGLIVGLGEGPNPRAALASSLLVIALADNLTDALAIHVYQESEKLDARQALRSTITNYLARLLVASTFVGLSLIAPLELLVPLALGWGMLLLATLTYLVARARLVPPIAEIAKHLAVAIVVILVSRAIGSFILSRVA